MKMTNEKKGISLIVLVITIIVMIILATVIILSLSNSGIIDKATQAKNETDYSNANDLVAMARAEWTLDNENIKEVERIKDFKDYANKKLTEAGYKFSLDELLANSTTSPVYRDKKIFKLYFIRMGENRRFKNIGSKCY